MKRWILLVTVLVVASLVLVACPTPTPQVVKETVVVTKEVEKVVTKEVEKVVTKEVEKVVTKEVEKVVTKEVQAPPQVVKLTAWTIGPDEPSFYRRDNLVDAAKRLNEDLKALGSNVTVELEATFDTGEWGDYKQKFILAAQAGNAPDIILSGHEDVAPWSEAGYIINLDDYIQQYWESTYQDIIPALWKAVEYKGHKWGVPQDTEARPMYFSKKLLRDWGWSEDEINALPEKVKAGEFTLYDMLETAKKAQDDGIVEQGHGYWTRPKKGGDFYHIYFAFGGEMQDPETGKLVVVKDALRKWLQFHYDTVFTYKTTPEGFIGTDWKIWHETVSKADKVLFWNGGTWHWAEWTQKYLDGNEQYLWDNVGFMLIPAGEPGLKPTTLSHPLVYMVSSSSKHPDLAFRIITLATTADLNSRHATNSGHLAILQSQFNHPAYKANKFLQQAAYMVEYTNFQPNSPDFGEYDRIMWTALSAVMAGDMSVDDAVAFVEDEMQAALGDKVIFK